MTYSAVTAESAVQRKRGRWAVHSSTPECRNRSTDQIFVIERLRKKLTMNERVVKRY
jgi:hypothetical protein